PKQIAGQLQLVRNGQTKNLQLDDSWLMQHYPDLLRAISMIKPEPNFFISSVEKTHENDLPLPVIWLRKQGTFWIKAEKGTPLRFVLAVRRIGRSELTSCSGTLTLPNGEVKKFTIPLESTQKFEYKIDSVSETGVSVLETNVGNHAVRLVQCNQPVAFPTYPRLNLIASPCRFYLFVPTESKEFGIRIRGEGSEAVKASIVDPAGQTVWSKDVITETVQFDQIGIDETNIVGAGKINGVWQIVFEKPSRLAFEDFSVTILGVPPILRTEKPELSK
ncbi:MAG: hypothetical protein LBQ50_00640, partial [Planctomycetaceae bacterium]|nr:hypothetical protein [Planctomycetaceae bacterium]